jgi:hypothetical protein
MPTLSWALGAKVSVSFVVIINSKIAESIAEVVVIIAMLRVHELVIGAAFLIYLTPKVGVRLAGI